MLTPGEAIAIYLYAAVLIVAGVALLTAVVLQIVLEVRRMRGRDPGTGRRKGDTDD